MGSQRFTRPRLRRPGTVAGIVAGACLDGLVSVGMQLCRTQSVQALTGYCQPMQKPLIGF